MTRVDSLCDGWTGGSSGYALFELCQSATSLMRGTYNLKLRIYNGGTRYGSGCATYQITLNDSILETKNFTLSTSNGPANPVEFILPINVTEYNSSLKFYVKDRVCSGYPNVEGAWLGVADANGPYLEGRYWE